MRSISAGSFANHSKPFGGGASSVDQSSVSPLRMAIGVFEIDWARMLTAR
jgi:hypothetical protein